MKLYKAGEKSKAICTSCKALVSTTFAYRNVPFDDGSGIVKDVLAGVCDRCGSVVSIPAQSTPAIRRTRDAAEISLEVFLPAPEMELLDVAAWRIDPNASTRFRKSLLAYYIRQLANAPDGAVRLREDAAAWKNRKGLSKLPRKRLSCKLSPQTEAWMKDLMTASGLGKTQLVRGVVHEIEASLVIPEYPEDLEKLREVAAVLSA